MNKKGSQNKNHKEAIRPVEVYFSNLTSHFSDLNNGLLSLFLSMILFGIMGLVWMIPFPQFQFLVENNMHTFLNWGSFFIAILVYVYLKLAPTLSYAILFTISIMSFFIVQLEYVERDGGPSVILVCSSIAILGFLGLFLIINKGSKKIDFKNFLQLLGIGPIWQWSKLFNRFRIKY